MARTFTHRDTGARLTVSGEEGDLLTGLVLDGDDWLEGEVDISDLEPRDKTVTPNDDPPAPSTEDAGGELGGDEDDDEDGDYDPSDFTVDEVKAYLATLPEDETGEAERQRVLTLESQGKARAGLLG